MPMSQIKKKPFSYFLSYIIGYSSLIWLQITFRVPKGNPIIILRLRRPYFCLSTGYIS